MNNFRISKKKIGIVQQMSRSNIVKLHPLPAFRAPYANFSLSKQITIVAHCLSLLNKIRQELYIKKCGPNCIKKKNKKKCVHPGYPIFLE